MSSTCRLLELVSLVWHSHEMNYSVHDQIQKTFFLRLIVSLSVTSVLWIIILSANTAWGATLRAYEKENSSRIIIESTQDVAYTLKQSSSDTYKFELLKDSFDTTEPISLSRISETSIDTPQTMTLKLTPSATLRHFKIGQKIIIDVHGKASPSSNSSKKKIKTISITEKTVQAAPVTVPPVEQIKAEDPSKVSITEDHVVQITTVENITLAAFTRQNYLWLVIDKPDFLISPQIQGQQQDLFSPFERIELPQATAFRTKLPSTKSPLHFYAEGGGLVWRLILTPDAKKIKEGQVLTSINQDSKQLLAWRDLFAKRIIKIKDPDFKDKITVVTTETIGKPLNYQTDYIELLTLPSFVGFAFIPKVDDLKTSISPENVLISRNSGLHVSSESDLLPLSSEQYSQHASNTSNTEEPPPSLSNYEDMKRIFQFGKWQQEGGKELLNYERLILSKISGETLENRIEDLIHLARFLLSHDRTPEAMGLLNIVEELNPEIVQSPEFIAVRGAVHALSGHYASAFEDFKSPLLDSFDEIKLWQAYTLAGLEDWNQAKDHLPPNIGITSLYPFPLQHKIALVLAEIVLRQGRINDGEDMLNLAAQHEEKLLPPDIATLNYLYGELARQNKDIEKAISFWKPLTKGKDDLYRAKAGLALTRLLHEENKISPEEAIDRLERLRYAWRGDDLETRINYLLGKAYINNKDYIHGLTILRKAASRSPDPELAKEIAAYMDTIFRNLLTTDVINDLDPIDAITLYEQFSELSPAGEEGFTLIQNLANRLVDIDLLGRAATLLRDQIDDELTGLEGVKIALRLASIELTDNKPSLALQSLSKAKNFLAPYLKNKKNTKQDSDRITGFQYDIELLKAYAYSLLKQPDNALVTLSRLHQNKQVLKMRADIAWKAERWQDASDALEELINRENINLQRPLSDEHRDLILNWSITLALSGNRYVLNNSRDRFNNAMQGTSKANEFDVITRPHKNIALSDRKTLENMISEISIFKGFLESYKNL